MHLSKFEGKGQSLEVKAWSILKFLEKTENMSKLVRDALFGTFCSR